MAMHSKGQASWLLSCWMSLKFGARTAAYHIVIPINLRWSLSTVAFTFEPTVYLTMATRHTKGPLYHMHCSNAYTLSKPKRKDPLRLDIHETL